MTILPAVPRRIVLRSCAAAASLPADGTRACRRGVARAGSTRHSAAAASRSCRWPRCHRAGCGSTCSAFASRAPAASTSTPPGTWMRPERCPSTRSRPSRRAGRIDGAFNRGRPLRSRVGDHGPQRPAASRTWPRRPMAASSREADCLRRLHGSRALFTTTGAAGHELCTGLPARPGVPASACGSTRLPGGSLRICEIERLQRTGRPLRADAVRGGRYPSGADGFRQLASGGCIGVHLRRVRPLVLGVPPLVGRWSGRHRGPADDAHGHPRCGVGPGRVGDDRAARGHLKPVTAVPAPDGSLLIGVAISDASRTTPDGMAASLA